MSDAQRLEDAVNLATLLCRRLCHDLASPIGSIINGLELLEKTPDTEIIQQSAAQARVHLEVLRLAFSMRPESLFSLARAQSALHPVAVEKDIRLEWGWLGTVKSEMACLVMNLVLTAFSCLPHGGVVITSKDVKGEAPCFHLEGQGRRARVLDKTMDLLTHAAPHPPTDSCHATAYLASVLARMTETPIHVHSTQGRFEMWVVGED